MKLEIERKFLLHTPPPGLEGAEQRVIRQGYLALEPEREVRLRQSGESFWLTVKEGSGLQRRETEIALEPTQFATLWPHTQGRRIEKVRYLFEWEGVTLEIDRYQAPHAPLMVVEIEFTDLEASTAFEPPPFLGEEVTGQRAYSNAALAQKR